MLINLCVLQSIPGTKGSKIGNTLYFILELRVLHLHLHLLRDFTLLLWTLDLFSSMSPLPD